MTQTEKLLCELIAIPSVNPAFLPANDPRAGEQHTAEFLAATAAHAGLEVELRAVAPGRPNIVARLAPRAKARQRIVLAPHLDTVGEPALSPSLFQPRLRGGRIYGRGACDTKGSVAAMLTALIQLAGSPARPAATEIVFAGLADEEHAQLGSRAFAPKFGKADLAIVGEPTRLKVVTAHKGNLWLRFVTRGKAAHGSRPELGHNAVHAMAKIADLLETRYAKLLRRRRHPILGHPTVNVGVISGGTQPNIVPDQCAMHIDRRTLPGESERTVVREIQALLRPRKIRATIADTKHGRCDALETDPDLPLARQFLYCASQKNPVGVDFFCDAAVLARAGIPSVVFGPGDIAQAHTANEWISRASLERGTVLLKRFLSSLP